MQNSLYRRSWCALLSIGLSFGLAGCGGPPAGTPVEGKATADGKPLSRGSVAFHPDEKKGNTSKQVAAGEITEGGAYKLFTDGKPGAPPGWYKVTVVSTSEPDSAKPEAIKSFVAPKFNDPDMTPLRVEVKAGAGPADYDLKVSAK
jgi:hypothetical protein